MKPRIAILLSGRGSNLQAILESVREGALADCCDVSLVFSDRPEAEGLKRARALGFPVASIASRGKDRASFDRELLELLEPHDVDLVVLAGFMRVLSPAVVRRYPRRIVNIHPADTRHHRGLHGYRWAFDSGLTSTVITVHFVDEGLDTGPIIGQAEVDLTGASTLEEVERRGLAVEHRFYGEVLRGLLVARMNQTRRPAGA